LFGESVNMSKSMRNWLLLLLILKRVHKSSVTFAKQTLFRAQNFSAERKQSISFKRKLLITRYKGWDHSSATLIPNKRISLTKLMGRALKLLDITTHW
jgi:hypothetical protein